MTKIKKSNTSETKDEALKTNYKDLARRYELSERMVWDKTANWKRAVIVKCKLANKEDRLLTEYVQEVIYLAETEAVLNDKLPPVPAFTLESEAASEVVNPS